MNEKVSEELKRMQGHPIKTSLIAGVFLISILWSLYRPVLIADLSADFVTKAELTRQTEKVTDSLATMQLDRTNDRAVLDRLANRFDISAAFQMKRGFQDDMDAHALDKTDNPSTRWAKTQRDLKDRYDLSVQYKNCLLAKRENCDELQKQLWQ